MKKVLKNGDLIKFETYKYLYFPVRHFSMERFYTQIQPNEKVFVVEQISEKYIYCFANNCIGYIRILNDKFIVLN